MAFPVTPGSGAMQMNANHRHNMRLMLSSLGLKPFMPFSPPYPGVGPGAQVSSDWQGLLEEAQAFEVQAYGALVGLVYWRALPMALRASWDQRINAIIHATSIKIYKIDEAGNTEWNQQAANAGNYTPAFQNAWLQRGKEKQEVERRRDYFSVLKTCKDNTFHGSSGKDLNDNDALVHNPWCLSDPEFRFVMQLISTGSFDPEAFKLHSESATWQKALLDWGKDAAIAYAKSKMEDALKAFLKAVPGEVGTVSSEAAEKIPYIGWIIDGGAALVAQLQKQRVIDAYKRDEIRRKFLKSVGWGTYTAPSELSGPSFNDYLKQAR